MRSNAFSTRSVGPFERVGRHVLGIHVGAETMGSTMEAAGRLQLGVFASGPLQEASLLQHAALEVSTITILTMQAIMDWSNCRPLVHGCCSLCCA